MTTQATPPIPQASDGDAPFALALSRLPEVGSRRWRRLMALAPTARDVWHLPTSAWMPALVGVGSKVNAHALAEAKAALNPEALWAELAEVGISVRVLGATDYPALLAEIADPPPVLYVRGTLPVRLTRPVGVVGTRRVSAYGRRCTKTLIEQMAPAGVSIVSGLAGGVDGIAHQTALELGLPTLAVFGTALDRIYPAYHDRLARDIIAAGGACLSEQPLGTPGDKSAFPRRNRIIAGLSQGVLVVDAPRKSGALITAREALDANRTVYAVPGDIFAAGSEGPNDLLRQGAVVVTHGEDILRDQGWLSEAGAPPTLPPQQMSLALDGFSVEAQQLWALMPDTPEATERLAAESGLATAAFNRALTELELAGAIQTLAGSRVCKG